MNLPVISTTEQAIAAVEQREPRREGEIPSIVSIGSDSVTVDYIIAKGSRITNFRRVVLRSDGRLEMNEMLNPKS